MSTASFPVDLGQCRQVRNALVQLVKHLAPSTAGGLGLGVLGDLGWHRDCVSMPVVSSASVFQLTSGCTNVEGGGEGRNATS